ncbi:mismatch-specific DNA-glycosylase [Cumulibacter manganitolerans]|uniref:mismatch-specific DNA-glycosylase n=1 Tax=Cumulibacter manganitolerans TaxID=1884992 RepID=UPI0012968447|nr:mismatch-specific DNA-glycosylase [Cumulibacter manganitolerans]
MTTRPTRADLEAARDAVIDDLLPDPLRLLVVGINPGLWTGATGAHFARPGNRFYPALARAGITDRLVDPSAGYRASDLRHLRDIGLGVTNLAPRTTARADELTDAELRAGAGRLVSTVLRHRPGAVAVAGITAYRTAFGERRARQGRQARWPGTYPEDTQAVLDATPLFVVPNPSGLNAHATVDSLAAAYREAADAAGMARFAAVR